jgi:hypothetical protein
MKKNYFLAVLFAFGMLNANAQFVDDMEAYTVGQPIYTGWWTDWACGGTCAVIASADQAQSGVVSGNVPNDGATDGVLDLGNKIFGSWGLEFSMYVPSGGVGYFNMQGTVPIGAGEWICGNWYFGQPVAGHAGTMEGYIDDTSLGGVDFDFPYDTWFKVVINVDINAGIGASTFEVGINGVTIIPAGTPFTDFAGTYPTSLGGIDFFSIDATNNYYVDDFTYQDSFITIGGAGINDLAAKGFTAYPNPVQNQLNLEAKEAISSVAIYNVLGQEVYSAQVNALNTTVNMSSFTSGAYFVKVNVGGTEGIVKILK